MTKILCEVMANDRVWQLHDDDMWHVIPPLQPARPMEIAMGQQIAALGEEVRVLRGYVEAVASGKTYEWDKKNRPTDCLTGSSAQTCLFLVDRIR